MRIPLQQSILAFLGQLGLRARIAVLVTFGLLALFAIFAILGVLIFRETSNAALQDRLVLARMGAQHLDYVLTQNAQLLQRAVNVPRSGLSDSTIDPRAIGLAGTHENVDSFAHYVFVIDRHGRLLWVHSRANGQPSALWTLRDYVAAILESGRPGITDVVTDPWVGQPTAYLISPLENSAGEIIGGVGVALDLTSSYVTDWISRLTIGATGYVQVVDSKGTVVMSSRPGQAFQKADHENQLATLIQEGRQVVRTCHDCHEGSGPGEPTRDVLAFHPLSRASWGVIVRQSEREALAPVERLQGQLVFLYAVSFLGAMGLVWLTTRSVLRPVQMLIEASERIAEGDLDTPIPSIGSGEVGALGRTFDSMRDRLRSSIHEIRDYTRELDARVQERTRELQESRDQLRVSRDRLQATLDSLSDELMVIDEDFCIQMANEALVGRFRSGQPNREVVGGACYFVSHNRATACEPPACECPVRAVRATGRLARAIHVHRDAEGNERYVEVIASPLKDAQGRVSEVIEILRDITEEKRLQEEILRRNRELSTLNAVATVVSQSLNLESTLKAALEKVAAVADVDAAAIHLVDRETGALGLAMYHGLSPAAAERIVTLRPGESIGGGVVQSGEPLVIPDVSKYRRARKAKSKEESLRSLAQVPLKSKGVVLGTLSVATREPHDFTAEEMELLSSIGGQVAMAIENAQLYEELQLKEKMRGELLQKVITAQEEERKRIARELHDETSQSLVALVAAIEMALARADDVTRVKSGLQRMRSLAERTLDEVHKLIFDLRPTLLDDLGLTAAIRWCAEARLGEVGIKLHMDTAGAEGRLPPQVETALFRVVQEAISNIAKHSGAENATISIEVQDSTIMIDIEDDGRGFVPSQMSQPRDGKRGLGLLGMKERVALLGGTLTISSQPASGTRLVIRVPLEIEGEESGKNKDSNS